MKSSLVLIAALAFPTTAFAQDPPREQREPTVALVVVPRVTVMNGRVRGRVQADEGIGPPAILDGTSVKYASDLDVDDSDPVFIFEIAAFHRDESEERYLERASISYLDASFEGSSTLSSTEDFNGRTFSAGTAIDSDLRYRSWGADFAVVEGDTLLHRTSGAVLMGLRYADMRVRMEGGGQETDERLRLLYLGAGFRGETRWGGRLWGVLQASVYFSLGGFEDWFDLEFEEWGGVIFEGQAGVAGSIGALHLEAGYRFLSNNSFDEIDRSDKFEDNKFIFQLGGPYLSATLRF